MLSGRENRFRIIGLGLGFLVFSLVLVGYQNATASPVVRRLIVETPSTSGSERVRIVLFADVHVHGPDMPPKRVGKIVQMINELHPDVVLAAGDFLGNNWIGRSYSPEEAIQPLGGIKARLGTYAVLGNNDRILGVARISDALRRAGVRVLSNEAVTVGPIALGGLKPRNAPWDSTVESVRQTVAAMDRLHGIKLLLTHEPDYFPLVSTHIPLTLAGHTHCGQIALPFVGPLITGSDYGRRYGCGLIRERGHALLITGGLGTSHVPLRLFAPPDIWILDLVPRGQA